MCLIYLKHAFYRLNVVSLQTYCTNLKNGIWGKLCLNVTFNSYSNNIVYLIYLFELEKKQAFSKNVIKGKELKLKVLVN